MTSDAPGFPPNSPSSTGQGAGPAVFHLHLVSDSTGETLHAVAKAAAVQFPNVRPVEHLHVLVRNDRQLDRALAEIESEPGIVLFTLVDGALRARLEHRCRELTVPAVAILDPVLDVIGPYIGVQQSRAIGAQYRLDQSYFRRIEAMNFAMTHDDGQNLEGLERADIVLVGVSRTSKTPTCIYLANRGLKAGNVPLVPGIAPPPVLWQLESPLVVGLVASPDRLVQIRRNRLLLLHEKPDTEYVDLEAIQTELSAARRLFSERGWPVIDVTRRSIEETAAAIIALANERKG